MTSLTNLFGDSRLGPILAVVIGLCVLGLLAIYLMRAIGRGVRPTASRSPRQPRLGIVDAFDLDRHRQLVLVRRDNVEHLIMIGGPNDLLIEGAIVRAQPAGVEGRREPGLAAPGAGDRAAPRLAPDEENGRAEPVRLETRPEPRSEPMRGSAPALDVKPSLEPAPALRPAIEPAPSAAPEPVAPPPPPPPLSRPVSPGLSPRPAPPPPRPLPPLRPVTPSAAGSKLQPPAPPRAAPPPPPPPMAPPSAPAPQAAAPEPRVESPAPQPPPAPSEPAPPRFAVNIDSLEEEMAKLLGRPPGGKS